MIAGKTFQTCAALTLLALFGSAARGDTIYFSNDFETNTTGFTAGGSLSSLSRVSLPTDSGGLASVNQSMWLGKLGDGVAKSGGSDELVTLNVSGLTTGQSYDVKFDLFIGASWDGSAGGFGPDSWRFSVDGARLVDTTFTNGDQGVEYGAFSPQKYSDTTYTDPTNPTNFGKFTGADASFSNGAFGGPYGGNYSIYRFGRGAGNPVLSFTATGSSAVLEFARYGNTSDSSDEYWALDNVQVSQPGVNAVPVPSSLVMLSTLALTTVGIGGFRKRLKSGAAAA